MPSSLSSLQIFSLIVAIIVVQSVLPASCSQVENNVIEERESIIRVGADLIPVHHHKFNRALDASSEISAVENHAKLRSTIDPEELKDYPPDFFPTFSISWGFGCVALAFSIILSSAAGIGGGGLYIPIFLFIFDYHLKIGHLLSHVMVLASAISQTAVNFSQKEADGTPVIKLRTCAAVTPIFLAGHAIGVTLFPIFPSMFVVLLLSLLLGFVSFQTGMKGWQVFQKEKKASNKNRDVALRKSSGAKKMKFDSSSFPVDDEALLKNYDEEEGGGLSDVENSTAHKMTATSRHPTAAEETTCETIVLSDNSAADIGSVCSLSTPTPAPPLSLLDKIAPVFTLAGVWLVLLLVYLLMGSPEDHSIAPEISVCSAGYWVAFGAGVLFCFLLSVVGAQSLQKSNESDTSTPYLARLLSLALLGGIFAGLVGIGGAQFIVPLLLVGGFSGVAASSTSALAVIVAVSSDVVRAGVQGHMTPIPHTVITVSLIAFFSAYLGRSIAVFISKRFNRQSPIVFTQFIVLALCCVLAFVSAVRDITEGDAFVFSMSGMC